MHHEDLDAVPPVPPVSLQEAKWARDNAQEELDEIAVALRGARSMAAARQDEFSQSQVNLLLTATKEARQRRAAAQAAVLQATRAEGTTPEPGVSRPNHPNQGFSLAPHQGGIDRIAAASMLVSTIDAAAEEQPKQPPMVSQLAAAMRAAKRG